MAKTWGEAILPKPLAITVGLPERADRERIIKAVQIADDLGVHSMWAGENWGRDSFTFLTEVALKTKNIGVATGIVNVFSRSPGVIAQTIAHIDEISNGRAYLGLGTSGQAIIEFWHGGEYRKPLRRMREYAEIINLIMAGEPLNYEGEFFQLNRGMKMRFSPLRNHIPIAIASITPASNVQTGEVADIWLPLYWPKNRLQNGLAQIREGARKAGRPEDACVAYPEIHLHVIDDEQDEATAKSAAREIVAFYMGRMGVYYPRMLSENGFADEVAAIQSGWAKRDPAAASAAVTDNVLAEISAVGTLDECKQTIEAWRQAGAAVPIVSLPEGSPQRIERILGTLME